MFLSKATQVKLTDLCAFILFSLLISTGNLIKFILPPGSGGDTVWGLNRHEWGDIHFYVSLLFLLFIALHLVLHRGFIKKAVTGNDAKKKVYRAYLAIACLVVFLLILIAPLLSPIGFDDSRRGHGYGKHELQRLK